MMLFRNKALTVDYMPIKQVEMYAKSLLKRYLGFDYQVFIYLKMYDNQFRFEVDETTMSDKEFNSYIDFCEEYDVTNTNQFFFQLLKLKYGIDYRFTHLVDDLKGVYIIRKY